MPHLQLTAYVGLIFFFSLDVCFIGLAILKMKRQAQEKGMELLLDMSSSHQIL